MSQVDLKSPQATLNMEMPIGRSRWTNAAKLLRRPSAILILAVGLLLSRGITKGEPFYNIDETRHIMNGVFIRDLLVDRPVSHPRQYAYEYYAKYPAISLPHWPPLFPFIEALFFLVFGVSVWASRLAILGFSLLAANFWYLIAERHGPPSRAFLSTFIFCLLPSVMTFESVTMLEIPQVALCLGTILCWLRWIETERKRDLWAVTGLAVAAMLTYQISIFLVIFLGLDFLLNRRFRLLRNWQVWAAFIVGLAAVLPWYLLSFQMLTVSYQRAVGDRFRHVVQRYGVLFYLRELPEQLGLVLLVFACIGLGWAVFRAASRYRFLLLWVVSAYLCFTLIREKDPRHILVWLPPLVYFALLGLEALLPWRRWFWVAYAALGLYFLAAAWLFRRPQFTGLEPVAKFIMAQPDSDIIYYQGALDGDFIFYVRRLDPQKSHMVARNKQVEVTNVIYGRQQVLRSPSQILDFFRTWGIRYAAVENIDPYPGLEFVHKALDSDQFEVVRTFMINPDWTHFPIRDIPSYKRADKITVYRYRGEIHRSTQPVDIPMMTIHRDITADLSRLAGRPWPN